MDEDREVVAVDICMSIDGCGRQRRQSGLREAIYLTLESDRLLPKIPALYPKKWLREVSTKPPLPCRAAMRLSALPPQSR